MAGEVGSELLPATGEQVYDSGREVGGREDLGQLERGERMPLGEEDDRRVARDDDGGQMRDEAEQVRGLGGDDPDHAGRLGYGEVEVGGPGFHGSH